MKYGYYLGWKCANKVISLWQQVYIRQYSTQRITGITCGNCRRFCHIRIAEKGIIWVFLLTFPKDFGIIWCNINSFSSQLLTTLDFESFKIFFNLQKEGKWGSDSNCYFWIDWKSLHISCILQRHGRPPLFQLCLFFSRVCQQLAFQTQISLPLPLEASWLSPAEASTRNAETQRPTKLSKNTKLYMMRVSNEKWLICLLGLRVILWSFLKDL